MAGKDGAGDHGDGDGSMKLQPSSSSAGALAKEKITPSRDDGKNCAAKPTKVAVQSFPENGLDLTDRFEQTKQSVSEHVGLPSEFQAVSFSASEGLSSILADGERKPPAKKARASESLSAGMNYHTSDKNTKDLPQPIWETTAVKDFRPNLHNDYVFDEDINRRDIPDKQHHLDTAQYFQLQRQGGQEMESIAKAFRIIRE